MAIKKKTLEDKSLADMEIYFRITNWADMWSEWYLKIGPDGRSYYKTVTKYAHEIKKSPAQGHFIHWLVGPKDEEDPRNELYPFAIAKGAPWDWAKKREDGGWHTDAALKIYSKKVRSAMSALDELREVGNDTTLNQVYRVEQMRQKVDRAFLGEFLVDGLNWKENQERASFYLHLQERLDKLSLSSVKQFALTRGLNYDDMAGFQQLISGVRLMQTAQQESSESENLLKEVIQMTMKKAKTYDLEVPKTLEESLETAAGLLPDPDKNKIH